jgi:N-methylhydantoinase B
MAEVAVTVDPITYEVISHRLWSINQEGSTTIVHASGSPVVHAQDYNFGLYAANGDMAVSGVYYTLPMFVMQLLIKEVLDEFGDAINPGDVFVSSDPFRAGIHQSDVQFVSPYFHDDRIVAWTGCMAHVMDVGGMNPGSWCPTATDLYQEGMIIPLSRIVEAGTVNRGLWNTVMSNSRLPAMLANDFSAFLSAHRVAQSRLREACEEYGGEAVRITMETTIDRTEQQLRELIRELPDGEFQHVGFVDHDGRADTLYRVVCTMTKRDDEICFDYAGTDGAILGMGNGSASGSWGAIGALMLAVFGSDLPWNAGLMRPIDIKFPENSVVSAEPPMPLSAGSVAGAWIASATAMTCLGKMLAFSEKYQHMVCGPPDGGWLLSQFGGTNQFGEPFANMFMDAQGWGGAGFPHRDGVDTGGSMVVPVSQFMDVETNEAGNPVFYLWRREAKDTGGAGRMRGGNGIEFALAVYDTDQLIATCGTQGATVPTTIGMFGGYPGATSWYECAIGSNWRERFAAGTSVPTISSAGGERMVAEAKCTLTMGPQDVMNHITQNGGGYGDPLERDPQRVLRDVLRGSVTRDLAHRVYGVVLDSDAVDEAATAAARQGQLDRRLADLPSDGRDHAPRDLPVVHRWADVINLVRDGDEILVQAAASGAILGPLGDDWRACTPWRRVEAEDLGPAIRLHADLELRQYLDPLTGRVLWLDFVRPGDEPLVDFRLTEVG